MGCVNVIFLDVDGVLNDYETKEKNPNGNTGIDDDKVKRLSQIASYLKAEIVLTSSWKFEFEEKDVHPDYDYLVKKLGKYNLKIKGNTQDMVFDRGHGILTWIRQQSLFDRDVDKFIILDDREFEYDLNPGIPEHVILTDAHEGGIMRMRAMVEKPAREVTDVLEYCRDLKNEGKGEKNMGNMKAIEIGKYIEFFIKSSQLVVPDKGDLKEAVDWAVEKAYGDAKRTMTGIGKFEDEKKKALEDMEGAFKDYFNNEKIIEKPDAFDQVHGELCKRWTSKFEREDANLATYGKAQKIVNMTFKYMYCWYYKYFHENMKKWEKIKYKFRFCHMTMDSYTLNWIYDRTCKEKRKNISFTKSVKWSSLESVEDYLGIEKLAEEAIKNEKDFKGMSAIEAEFLIWDYEMIREKTNEWVKAMEKYVKEDNHYPDEMVESLGKTKKAAEEVLDKFTLPPSSGKNRLSVS